ncbi:MAG: hypothetical protein ACE5GI_05360, partial [Candidatus Aminicenantales bacterium]
RQTWYINAYSPSTAEKEFFISLSMKMLTIAFGKKDKSSQIHRLSPKLAEKLALNLDMLDHWVSIGILTAGMILSKLRTTVYPLAGSRCTDFTWLERFPGEIEPLAFPLIHMGPDGMTVRAMKFGININQALNKIIPAWISFKLFRGWPSVSSSMMTFSLG